MKRLLLLGALFALLGTQSANAQEDKKDAVNRELLELIRQLKSEVESLKKEVKELRGKEAGAQRDVRRDSDRERESARRDLPRREGDSPRESKEREMKERDSDRRDGERREGYRRTDRDRPNSATPPGDERREVGRKTPYRSASRANDIRKYERIFAAYDKNKDKKVSFEEWLGMKEGKMTDSRAAREKKVFGEADKTKDNYLSFEEFYTSRTKKTLRREGDSDRRPESKREGVQRDGDRREGERRSVERREGERDERAERERGAERERERGERDK